MRKVILGLWLSPLVIPLAIVIFSVYYSCTSGGSLSCKFGMFESSKAAKANEKLKIVIDEKILNITPPKQRYIMDGNSVNDVLRHYLRIK